MCSTINKRTLCIGIIVICKLALILYLYRVHKADMLQGIEQLAVQMRSTQYSVLIMTAIVCLSCVPPLMGFTLAITMCGYIYHCPFGFIPAIMGANLGAIMTFLMIRRLRLDTWLNSKKKYSAVSAATREGGFKMILLIRLSLPWHLTSVILSTNSGISFNIYCLSSCLGSLKLMWAVWLGSQMANLNNPQLPPQVHRYTKISLGVTLSVMVFVCIWLYRLTRRKIRVKHDEQEPLLGHTSALL